MALAAQDLFKAYYHLEPGHVQSLTAYISLPFSLKIVIGLISDSVPIFGSRRKAYILMAGMTQFTSMLLLFSTKS